VDTLNAAFHQEEWRANLLLFMISVQNTLLSALGLLFFTLFIIQGKFEYLISLPVILFIILMGWFSRRQTRQEKPLRGARLFFFATTLALVVLCSLRGYQNESTLFLLWPILGAILILGTWEKFVLIALTLLSYISFILFEVIELYTPPLVSSPENNGVLAAVIGIVALSLISVLVHQSMLQFQRTLAQVKDSYEGISNQNKTLKDQVEVRSQEIEKRTVTLATAAEVSQATLEISNLDELLPRIIYLISERFGYYQVGIFLLDEKNEYAVLRAASSEGGQRLLARSHRLRVGEQGIVGFVTSTGQARIALDVGEDAVYFNNPELPDTRSEMALPLMIGGSMFGALDVQSREPAAFTTEDVAILQVLADQVAMAIQSTTLYQRIEHSIEAERRAYGELSRAAWQRLSSRKVVHGYLCNPSGIVKESDAPWTTEMQAAAQTGNRITSQDGLTIAIPIRILNNIVGSVRLQKTTQSGRWASSEIELIETLTEQLGLALENARLYQATEQRAVQEQLSANIITRLRESMEIENILQTAVRELSQALGAPEVAIRLGVLHPNDTPIE
jgi:GAF domain-containing protein